MSHLIRRGRRLRGLYAGILLLVVLVGLAGGPRAQAQDDPPYRVYLPWVAAPAPPPALDAPARLRVVGWNVQSGGSDPETIARQIAAFPNVDLWGLSEVSGAADAARFAQAAAEGKGAPFGALLGTTGGSDRLLILYDADRFFLRGSVELKALNWQDRMRAPLYAHLYDRTAGLEYLFMVNHLYAGNQEAQNFQSDGLRRWAQEQWLPVIAPGDYNYRWQVEGGDEQHDEGYDRLTRDGVWAWVRPALLVPTFCYLWPCVDEWVLDFVFVAGAAQQWPATATIVVRDGDFPDTELTSDHRPVMAEFLLPVESVPAY
jgi:hypothetical protein